MYYKLADHESDISSSDSDLPPPTTFQNILAILTSPYAQLFTIFLLFIQSIFILSFSHVATTTTNCPKQTCPTYPVQKRPELPETKDSGFIKAQFERDMRYMTLDHQYDYLWNETAGSGMIMSADGIADGTEEVGSISMFHQLHCLTGLRTALQESSEGKDIGFDWTDNLHWPHCLDLLRNVILCYGDGTIEREDRSRNGTLTGGISGSQDWRQCRPTRPLYEMREKKGINT